MATAYVGYRHILTPSREGPNTFTGQTGVYSNWQLMFPGHVLDGAPDHNRVPGSGPYGEGDVVMSRWFLGLDVPMRKSTLRGSGILHPDVYSGRWVTWMYRGLQTTNSGVFPSGYGHQSLVGIISDSDRLKLGGAMAAYALWSNYFYAGLTIDHILDTTTLGHKERYPTYVGSLGKLGPFGSQGQAATFGAFEPYLYKGLTTTSNPAQGRGSNPMGKQNTGHPEYAPSVVSDAMPSDYGQIPAARATVEHYGFEHVREYFGLTVCKALDVSSTNSNSKGNTGRTLPPEM